MKIVIEFDSMDEVRDFASELIGSQPMIATRETMEPMPEEAPKKRKSRAKKADPAPEPVVAEPVNGNGSTPSLEALIPILKDHASKHGAGTVREALTKLGVSKLSQLDEAGRLALTKELNI